MHQAQFHNYTSLLTQGQRQHVQDQFSKGQKSQFTQLANSYVKKLKELKEKRQTKGIQQQQADLLLQQQKALRQYVLDKQKQQKLQQQQYM